MPADVQDQSTPGLGRFAWLGVPLVAIAAGVCVLAGVDKTTSLVIIALTATLGIFIALFEQRRRAGALATLKQAATRMLGANIPVRGEGGLPWMLTPGVENLPAEFAPLAGAMANLGERMQIQLKDVARHSRNLEALIDAMDEPLLATDSADRVILGSRSAGAILDMQGRGIIGRRIDELFTTDEVLRMHAQARAGQIVRGRVRIMTPLGKRTFQISAAPVPAAWGEGVFGAVLALRDVTELDQAVQVKTDFVANASHELRTPVAAIRSAAETLEAAADDPAMSARLRGMIVSHAMRLEEMLRDLLDLSRLESPDMPLSIEAIDMVETERTLLQLSEHICKERSLTIAFELEDELFSMRTDRKLLLLILRNLVENATKFAHEGTTIRVVGSVIEQELAGPDRPGTRNGVSNSHPSRTTVRFEVIDRGVGIPLAHQERVFERYYQVDPARTGTSASGTGGSGGSKRGTGLGLAIVKHAAKALHGRCGLSSVWGQGTTAFVEIPVELAEEATERRSDEATKQSTEP